MKILILVCGEGLGHTSRCVSLGRELTSANHEVLFGAYGYSKEFIEGSGYQTREIPSEIRLVGRSGSLDLKASIGATLKEGDLLGAPRIFRLFNEFNPDAVVSDSYYLGVLAAKAKKLPVYFIINQSNMEEFFKNKGVPYKLIGEIVKRFYSTVFKKVDKIVIPDFPMPYTICQYNLSFQPEIAENVFYSGPLIKRKYHEVEAKPLDKPHILSAVGGFGYREPIFRKVIETAKKDSSINYTLMMGPTIDPEKYSNLPENVGVMDFYSEPFPYFKSVDAVIAPGGHTTIMEALSFGVPVLSFPDMNHSEQENNARVIDEMGYGRCLNYSTSSEELLHCIKEITDNSKFKENTQKLKDISKDLDGPVAIMKMLENRE
ncbi:Glycosyltransferase 28 domain protein [Methanohalobium evestigatum Z-7303]|uniref:Glycosyltransferase 28 domain protein n=1 Tax=Methanohalobium evestigatum (strain ATCC BAA-1072 / DSM 3721 / NBRC 107634 / OCM 161 / Z-7303) TaxID=644295 RepID=D7E5R3_METEZ|nr:glycosyltransferase [Methanohalobium evestigatum]ADI72935.1 Glycosyltransferase 28 domain protein [Methanohalobium evestigatum Z-7303]